VQRKILPRGPWDGGLPAQCLGIQAAGSLERVNTHEYWEMVIVVAAPKGCNWRTHAHGWSALRLASLPDEESGEDGRRQNGFGACRARTTHNVAKLVKFFGFGYYNTFVCI